ncbi:MAG: hypothetical protein H7Y31_07915 [Chitinophagaceae bacterium]|nr:hypothetical protein [Chitinophagaceae bacterium]
MRWILILTLLISLNGYSQWKDYTINANKDTLNRVDMSGKKQGPWSHRYETVRGEPGYEEEGFYENDRKIGEWRMFNLSGDLVGIENYKWGFKDGVNKYFSMHGDLRLEQSWKALNPDKEFDTIMVEDLDKLDSYRAVIVKNEGASLKHGTWKYYDESGGVSRTETFTLGKQEKDNTTSTATTSEKKAINKPKEVLDFEKKNSGKKKVKVKDGSTGG